MDSGYIMKRLGLFFLPIVVSALVITLVWLGLDPDMFTIIGLLLVSYFISPFGREVLIPMTVISLLDLHGSTQMFSDIVLVVGTVVFVDVMCSIFLLWNLDLLKFLPVFGKWIDGIEKFGRKKLEKSQKKQQNVFLALTGYVALPFQGSGGIMSTIIGMLTGLKKQSIWISVWIGSFVGSLIIAIMSFYSGQVLIDIFGSTLWYFMGLFLVIGIFVKIVKEYIKGKAQNQ